MKELLRILMLEDTSQDAEIIQRLILNKELNCEFSLVTNKAKYLKALDEFHPDIILSDHSLPQFTSVDALTLAREKCPGIPFIIVTGSVSEEFAADIIKLGADDYILKDRLTRLPNAIISVLQKRKFERENQEAEQKIIQSENNLRIIFENASEGFFLLDRNAILIAFNKKMLGGNLFGKVVEFKTGQPIYNFVEESRKKTFQEIISRVLDGEPIQYDRSYDAEDGSIAWIDFSIRPIIESGEVKGICITARDITEKKIIEQEKEFDRNNLKALINNTNDLMWSVDRDFKLITSNEAFDKKVQTMSGNAVTKGSYILASGFSDEQLNNYRKYYEQAFSGESFTEIEYTNLPDDSWSEISFYPIYNRDTIIGCACFSRDITWRKKAEEERREYIKSLEEMLFKISHEIRSSIAHLLGLAHITEHPNNSFEELKKIVSYISPTIDTLDKFSRELTKFVGDILQKNKKS